MLVGIQIQILAQLCYVDVTNLGKISLVDGESIAIYEVELSDKVDIERNRRGIRDMLTTDWRNMGYACLLYTSDMGAEEHALVKALIANYEEMRVIAVGDDDQNIYEFRGSCLLYTSPTRTL